MRDFPIFTTDFGVSSLVLREIPYKKEAYICIRDAQPGEFHNHMRECIGFCKMAGAEHIYATGHECLDSYPLVNTIVEMRTEAVPDTEKIENLFPVTDATVSRWREIYNQRMRGVFNSRTLESRDEKEILESGGAYFIHRNGTLLGIGWIQEEKILAIAAVVPGSGERVLHTLLSLLEGETVLLEVASSNERAIRLYERLGFLKTQEVSRWYDVT